ncbi:MAG: hypothetical protein JWP81_361 [Ferruginibacter sp.]|nr:hypothetical protein [Ferruginibacter sp.]
MKKLLAILAVTAFMTSCNDTDTKSSASSDSAKAAATADSLAAINAMSDTTKAMDTTMMKADSSAKVIPTDTTKKK